MTTERIAAAIKPILDEDRRADRERIAELERDNHAVVQCCAELREAIDVYLAEIQRLTEKCAALVVERDFYKGAAPSMLQAAAPGSAPHTTGGLVVDHAQEMMKRGISPELARAGAAFLGAVETPAVEVKEQGPWVVYDVDEPNWRMRDAWVYTIKGEGFDSKEEAQKIIDDFGRGGKKMRVITLAEARAIEAKR